MLSLRPVAQEFYSALARSHACTEGDARQADIAHDRDSKTCAMCACV